MRVRCFISWGVRLVQDMIEDECRVMDKMRGRDLPRPNLGNSEAAIYSSLRALGGDNW
jgi:hypothetical protein